MNFLPFPELESDRLVLRRIDISDSDVILFLRSDKTVTKYIKRPENRKIKNVADALNFINQLKKNLEINKSIAWGIALKKSPAIIGTICLWNFSIDNSIAEVGYDLDPKYHGNGFMDESLKAIINFGFNKLKLCKIEAFTHYENEKSIKLLMRNGFQFKQGRRDEENSLNSIYELEMPKNYF
ncbi:GNAT family N-acetyltransferase [Lutibacter sp.]|uniref:GNAT family N-acetyltransferase n=1 Tax=Lutibacter sp. TaxID=1925666 RepID=UPI003568912F